MAQVTGMQQTMEFSAGVAQFDPAVFDNFNGDEMVAIARDLLGAPPTIMNDPQQVQQNRFERAQAESAQQALASVPPMADALESVSKAAENAPEMADMARRSGVANLLPRAAA